ncbi:MAG: C25 family cysteine peptidase [Bacteroidota bacterium]|nr:C25 family cysteine peptidase [Bacteroidota bacterium]
MKSLIQIFVIILFVVTNSTAQWVNLKGSKEKSVTITLRGDTPSGTIIEFTPVGYYLKIVNLEGKTYSVISIPKAVPFLEKGYPELPRVSRSVMVSDEAKMKIEILEVDCETTYVAPILSSKGNIHGSIDPESVPYTFSDVYKTDKWWPEQVVDLSDPFILRDIRGITVRFNPFRYNAVRGQLITCKQLIVRVYADGVDDKNIKTNRKGVINRDFSEIYERFFLNFHKKTNNALGKTTYTGINETGRMLIIAADDFYNNVIPLRDWRTRKGLQTILVKCSNVGTTFNSVFTYIQNMYLSESSVTYILLVGDGNTPDVPMKSVPFGGTDYHDPKDPLYSLLEFEIPYPPHTPDPYPDAYISRISAENTDQVDNQVRRILKYETNPPTGNWFQQASGIASQQYGDTTDCNLLRDDLIAYGYTSVDKLYNIGSAQPISDAINAGRSFVNFDGHGSGASWSFSQPYVNPLFSIANVQNLVNTNMLPFVFSVGCEVGDFADMSTCFAEAWLRSGTKDNPTGAIGFYGSSVLQGGTIPKIAQTEAVDILVADAKVTIGGLCYNASCKMIESQQPNEIAEFKGWNIFGDAATQLWTKVPTNFTSVSVTDNGSSITVNVGVAGSTICVSSGNNGATYWDRQDNVSSSTFTTSVRPLYVTVTKHNYIPYTAVTGGMFASNEFWFGNMKVLGNITLNRNYSLTIPANTNISFANGTSLYVYGVLNVNGTSSSPVTFTSISGNSPGSWGSIILSGTGTEGSNLNYITMQYGTDLQFLNSATGTIQNSILQYNTRGVYIYNSQPDIINNSIYEVQQDGILCNAAGYSPLVKDNTITKTSGNSYYQNYSGINIGGSTTYGYLPHNDIKGFYYGMYIGGGPTVHFVDRAINQPYPNNRIMFCLFGITAGWGSYVSNVYYSDYNSIYSNAYYDLYAYNSSNISLGYNYYGGGNPTTYTYNSSWINYYTPLTWNPWEEYFRQAPLNLLSDTQEFSALTTPARVSNTETPQFVSSDDETGFEKGLELERQKDYTGAIAHYTLMLKAGKISRQLLAELAHVGSEYGSVDVVSYFETMKNSKSEYQAYCMQLLAGLYMRRGEKEKSAAVYDEIIANFSNTHDEKMAQLQKFYYILHVENDIETAQNLLNIIATRYAEDDVERDVVRAQSILSSSYVSPKESKDSSNATSKTLNNFVLFQNYPNPFNPITTISYKVPQAGKVSLKVYDGLGREVIVLVNGQQSEGAYNTQFDGTTLASGIYFYRLHVGSYIETKKLVLMK